MMTETLTAKKFLFESSFDEPSNNMSVDDAPEPTYTQAQLDATAEDAFAKGRQAGLEESLQTIEKFTGDLCGAITERLIALVAHYDTDRQHIQEKSLAVVLHSLQQLAPHVLRKHGLEEIEILVKQCLEVSLEMPKLFIKVSADMQSPLESRLNPVLEQAGLAGKYTISSDPALQNGDCRIEWGSGGMEHIPSTTWQQIQTILSQAIPPALAASLPADPSIQS